MNPVNSLTCYFSKIRLYNTVLLSRAMPSKWPLTSPRCVLHSPPFSSSITLTILCKQDKLWSNLYAIFSILRLFLFSLSKMAWALKFQKYFGDAPGSNLLRNIVYPGWGVSWFSSVPPSNRLDSTSKSGREASLNSLYNSVLIIILSYNSTQPELQTAPLKR
jgi:hypothetical protein